MSGLRSRGGSRRPRLLGRGQVPDAAAVALLLPGGAIRSRLPPLGFSDLAFLQPRRWWARNTPTLAVHLLRYRYWGWNDPAADTSADTAWALGQIRARYGRAPVVLVGNSLGGRAAFAQAADPSVCAVVGIAPWLPPGEPIDGLQGRRVLIVHGGADRSDAPAAWSLDYAERARAADVRLARFEAPGAGHTLLTRTVDWGLLACEFVAAAAGLRTQPEAIDRAFLPDAGLHTPLPRRQR